MPSGVLELWRTALYYLKDLDVLIGQENENFASYMYAEEFQQVWLSESHDWKVRVSRYWLKAYFTHIPTALLHIHML